MSTLPLVLTPGDLDAALDSSLERYYVKADNGSLFAVRGRLSDGTLLVKGRYQDSPWKMVVVTSHTWQSRPRVRFTVAQDHGYGDGRVTFDGNTFGGFMDRYATNALGVTTP